MNVPKNKLLIVDDEVEICNFVRFFFEKRGFVVDEAYDGYEAIRITRHFLPHVVILDMMMKTEREGLEVLPTLRRIAPDSKILIVTGVDDQDCVEKCRRLGATDYITKPLVLEYLENTVLKKIRKE
jgi:DNA-binding response OmpR family regulator